MKDHFEIIKGYINELNYTITSEHKQEGVLMIQNESEGIKNLILGIAAPILIIEQYMFKISQPSEMVLSRI